MDEIIVLVLQYKISKNLKGATVRQSTRITTTIWSDGYLFPASSF